MNEKKVRQFKPVSRNEENSGVTVKRRKHVWNIVGGSVHLAEDDVFVGGRHLLRQLGVDGVELLAVLALGGEDEEDGVFLHLK